MVTCIQCGTALDEGETTCSRCGATAPRGDAASGTATVSREAERAVPAGKADDTLPATEAKPATTRDDDPPAEGAPAEATQEGDPPNGDRPAAATDPGADGEGAAPAGTWSEQGTGEQPKLPEPSTGEHPQVAARESRPAVLEFREADQLADERPDDAPALRPERVVRDPDLTPVPGLALALASVPEARDDESTGTRPAVQPRATDSGERRMGEVVPLRRESRGDRESSAGIGKAASTARVEPEPDAPAEAPEPASAPEATAPETSDEPRRSAPELEETGKQPVDVPSAESTASRKPVLASEILREDLTPTEPGRSTLRWTSVVLGTVGAAAVLLIAGIDVLPVVVGALLLGIATMGALPTRYEARAIGVAALGMSGLAVAIVATGVAAVPPILVVVTLVLGSGLLFRGTYRASVPSRWMVATGIALGVVWFVASDAAAGLTVMDVSWQSIGGSVIRLGFVLLLLLSLLAFMDASTTAGCRQWGTGVLAWYAIFVVFEMAVRQWPPPGQVPASAPDGVIARFLPGQTGAELTHEVAAMTIAGAAFVFVAGFAGSQILVSASGGTITRRRKADESRAGDSTPSGEIPVGRTSEVSTSTTGQRISRAE